MSRSRIKSAADAPPEPPVRNGNETNDELRSTRGRILSAAQRLFAEHGFGNVSMPMIAKASGITAGAIYRHYDSKADLFFEVVRRTVQSVRLPNVDGSATGVAALPGIVAMYTTPRLKLLRQLALEIHSASAKHPKVRRLLRQSIESAIAQIGNDIAAAQQLGEIDPTLDPTLLASAVMVFIMGLMHMETLVPHLVGDSAWHDFVWDRAGTLIGLR
jgi:AcrR family transcriptional regulator